MAVEKFNNTIDLWIADLSRLNNAMITRKPDDGSWTVGQLYQHLLDETKWYFGQLEEAMKDEERGGIPTSEKAAALFQRGSFEDVRIKGDPLISENVRQPLSLDALLTDMRTLKERAAQLAGEIARRNPKGKSEHPGLGFFTAAEWLTYSEMHMRHHLRQKARIERFLENSHESND